MKKKIVFSAEKDMGLDSAWKDFEIEVPEKIWDKTAAVELSFVYGNFYGYAEADDDELRPAQDEFPVLKLLNKTGHKLKTYGKIYGDYYEIVTGDSYYLTKDEFEKLILKAKLEGCDGAIDSTILQAYAAENDIIVAADE